MSPTSTAGTSPSSIPVLILLLLSLSVAVISEERHGLTTAPPSPPPRITTIIVPRTSATKVICTYFNSNVEAQVSRQLISQEGVECMI